MKILLFMLMFDGSWRSVEMPSMKSCEEAAAKFSMQVLSTKTKAFCVKTDGTEVKT